MLASGPGAWTATFQAFQTARSGGTGPARKRRAGDGGQLVGARVRRYVGGTG